MRATGLILGTCCMLLVGAPALAQTSLTGGRLASFKDKPGNLHDVAVIKFTRDPGLTVPLPMPLCPKVSTLRIEIPGHEVVLDLICERWRVSGRAYLYKDPAGLAGGVRSILLREGKLIVKLKGANYEAFSGAADWVEAQLTIGPRSYCGRFETFRFNQPDRILSRGPSGPCVPKTATPTPLATMTPTPQDTSCPAGLSCAAFDIVPGSGALLPTDDGASTWLRVFDFTGGNFFGNATNGQFDPGPVLLARGAADGNGRSSLEWLTTTYVGANLPDAAHDLGQQGRVCLRIQQDPDHTGWIDCDGGTNAAASITVDSNLGAPPPPNPVPVLSAPGAADGAAPAGSALVRVILQLATAPNDDVPCNSLDYASSPAIPTAFTTATGTSTVTEDLIDGNGPASRGVNSVSLAGTPFACASWGAASGPNASIVAPLFALDFIAPILGVTVDVSQAARLQLEPRSYPSGNDTPTATRTPTATATDTPLPPTPTPTSTPTAQPTSTRTFTPVGPIISNVSIDNASGDWGPDYQAFGNCYEQAKTAGSVMSLNSTSFSTRFQQSVATDCEAVPTGGGGITASQNTAYTINFDVACPAGSTYQLNVSTSLNGAFTINRDNFDGCDAPFFGTTGNSTAQVGLITGGQSGGMLGSGSLNLTSPGSLSNSNDANSAFNRTGVATITGIGTGAPAHHTLTFTWNASCSSNGNSTDTGAECAVRLGLPSDLAPNGISGCSDADDYPGVGSRDANFDGHFVSLTGSCGAAPTSTPTITPGGPTLTPTPTATPLGVLQFSVATGPGGSDTAPGCPGEPSSGSLLRTHGNPTGGVPGTVCNGTKGDFYTVGGNLQLSGGSPDSDGIAPLSIVAPIVVGASLPGSTPDCGNCDACWRFEQDASPGFVDCDGGSGASVSVIIDSNGSSAPPAPASGPYVLGGSNGGAGAAVVLAKAKRLRVGGTCPAPGDSAWNGAAETSVMLVTGSATSRITEPRRCSGSLFGTACPSADPYEVVLTGANFTCANWAGNTGGRLVVPFHSLDESIGGDFGTGDIAQVLRLAD